MLSDVLEYHTDNGIIPLKERVADVFFDPLLWVARKLRRKE